jgi:hypothetical protein
MVFDVDLQFVMRVTISMEWRRAFPEATAVGRVASSHNDVELESVPIYPHSAHCDRQLRRAHHD